MAKRRSSKTRQGLCGLTLAQGHRLTRDPVPEQNNTKQFVSQYEAGDGNVQMPLNRSMRRYAKHIGIKLTKVTK
ncbi:hypothetical protein [Klebsiella michiganensis]|uniref:hypothetical protein n=1 Tax=Klebsiella michiganensis TaxID=1134687 RepID=UPI00277BE17C|nr:hypothetical protein [Klebsiella michiganensis]HDS8617934.1 hypothetical protein [Klebsiella michiganensis]